MDENNIQPPSICGTNTSNDTESKDGLKDMSQSHAHIHRIKKEELRSTKSFELHHTRSFSEIRHLHPSSTDVSFGITCPKPRNIEALQKEVKRPESVLEMSDLSVQEGEDDVEEDVTEAQEKGDKAMQLFMQSNISVPLDGAMSSTSSCSLQSLDSDMASEHELIVGTWKTDAFRGLLLLNNHCNYICTTMTQSYFLYFCFSDYNISNNYYNICRFRCFVGFKFRKTLSHTIRDVTLSGTTS